MKNIDKTKLSGSELFELYSMGESEYGQILFQAHLEIGDKLFDMLEECEKTGKKIVVKDEMDGVIDPPIKISME